MKSFLTVDWGGTALKGYFYSSESCSLRHFKFPSMNLKTALDIDIMQSLRNIASIVTDVCENPDDVTWIIGAAGAATIEAEERMNDLLGHGKINLFPDYLCNCKAALGKADGCVSVNGTGSILFARSRNDLKRFGGWGYLFDTAPSGSYFGKLAIEGALLALDDGSSDVFKPFLKSVESYIQLEKVTKRVKSSKTFKADKSVESFKTNQAELLQNIYQQKNMQTFFSKFSRTITSEFDNGNVWAEQTILASIDMLVDQIEDASFMFDAENRVKLCGIGGLWTEWKSFESLVKANIKKRNLAVDVMSPSFKNEWGPVLHYYEDDDTNYQELIQIIETVTV